MPTRPPNPTPECEPTPMPSVQLELGEYVTLRPRKDGTFRVYFQVPARLRPSDWPSLIPLPIKAERTGDLANPGQVAAIQADARALYDRLKGVRDEGAAPPPRRSLRTLVRQWQKTDAWKTLKPRSQEHYGTYINHILTWSETAEPQHPDPTKLTRADIEGFLSLFDGQDETKRHCRKTMRLVMDQAVALAWRTDNPCDGIRLKRQKKSKAGVWEQADVDLYVETALRPAKYSEDRKSLAAIIELEWEIGQRLTDVRGFRPGAEYDQEAGVFRFFQEKTGTYVTIRISARLQALLAELIEDGQLFLFRNEATGKAYTEKGLSKAFAWLRKAVVAAGGRFLLMKWLRHSCVVQLARKECTIPEICAVTGHSIAAAAGILSTYLPRDSVVAENAQVKRGLVERAG